VNDARRRPTLPTRGVFVSHSIHHFLQTRPTMFLKRIATTIAIAVAASSCAHEAITRQARDQSDYPLFDSRQKLLVNGYDGNVKQEIANAAGNHEVVADQLADQATVLIRAPEGAGSSEESRTGIYLAERDEQQITIERSCKKRAKPEKGKKGEGKCIEWKPEERYTLYSITESCQFALPVEVLEIAGGAVVFSGNKAGTATSKDSKKGSPPPGLGQKTLCLEARRKAVADLAALWQPRMIQVDVKLAVLKSNEALHQQVVRLIKQSADKEALEVMEAAVKGKTVDASDEAALEYNMTQIYWLNQKYPECKEHFTKAVVLNTEPMPMFLTKACGK
jgi:hypothetical protein